MTELTALIRTQYPAYDGRGIRCPRGCGDSADTRLTWRCDSPADCLAHWRVVVWAAKRRRAYPTLAEVGL